MLLRTGMAVVLIGASASLVQAQREPPVDSLIDRFIELGTRASWGPNLLFIGCPDLAEWQERGFRRLAATDLSRQRTDDLAAAWMFALRDCHEPRLERWYLDRMNAAIQRGQGDMMLRMWTALDYADTQAIRAYLRGLMVDAGVPASIREQAGAQFFVRLTPEERMREFLRAFEDMRLPPIVASEQTRRLLEQDADLLLREIGRLVQADAAMADQGAFTGIVESSARYASARSRRELGEALQAGLDMAASNLGGRKRQRLESTAQYLKSSSF